ncbi:MAG: PAS domain-containing protein [Rhizobiaceae bacterium]
MNRETGAGRVDDWHMTDDLHAPKGKADPFAAAMRATRMAMIVTDPKQPDNPIVFVNDAFLKLTGYDRSEVVGSNCRFLQGEETDAAELDRVRQAVVNREPVNVDLLNYRKDGSTFWNSLYISPVSDEDGELQYFFGSQLDITERKSSELRARADKRRFEQAVKDRTRELEAALEAQTVLLHEVDHRVKNNLQMVSSLILMQSRSIPDEGIRRSLRSMLARVEALSTVHRRLYQSDDVRQFDVADFVRDLVPDLVAASGRSDVRAELDLARVDVPAQKAAPVALMVNELVTNALKHGFNGGRAGTISVSVRSKGQEFEIEVRDDGTGMSPPNGKSSFGTDLVKALARQLQAKVTWEPGEPGTRVMISLPVESHAAE